MLRAPHLYDCVAGFPLAAHQVALYTYLFPKGLRKPEDLVGLLHAPPYAPLIVATASSVETSRPLTCGHI